MTKPTHPANRGLTLVEIVVALGVLGVLAKLALMLVEGSTQAAADQSSRQDQLAVVLQIERIVSNPKTFAKTRALPANSPVLAAFDGVASVGTGYLSLAQNDGSVYLRAAGSGFDRNGRRCAHPTDCALYARLRFVPVCPGAAAPPCATDLARLEATLTVRKEVRPGVKSTARDLTTSWYITAQGALPSAKQLCGGARSLRAGAAGGCMAVGADGSCDRWGCAVADAAGNGDCPGGTSKIITSDNPTYFICLN